MASAAAQAADPGTDFTQWLDTIIGKHMQVYDAPDPNDGMVLIYAWAFLSTAPQAYGVAESDVGVVIVLRRFATTVGPKPADQPFRRQAFSAQAQPQQTSAASERSAGAPC